MNRPAAQGLTLQPPYALQHNVSQLSGDRHRGRVVLVGDAAHCASPLSGRGTALALTGLRRRTLHRLARQAVESTRRGPV